MKITRILHRFTCAIFALALLFLSVARLIAQENTAVSSDPLQPFSRLIDGEWHTEGSYQVFEWGVGKKSVKSRSYFKIDGKPKLVSEGLWFWHPGEKRLKGYFTAIEMPVVFFDYTTKFEENKMVNELKSYSPKGKEENYLEIWEFTDDNHYVWTLFSITPEGQTKVMGATYTRIRTSNMR